MHATQKGMWSTVQFSKMQLRPRPPPLGRRVLGATQLGALPFEVPIAACPVSPREDAALRIVRKLASGKYLVPGGSFLASLGSRVSPHRQTQKERGEGGAEPGSALPEPARVVAYSRVGSGLTSLDTVDVHALPRLKVHSSQAPPAFV